MSIVHEIVDALREKVTQQERELEGMRSLHTSLSNHWSNSIRSCVRDKAQELFSLQAELQHGESSVASHLKDAKYLLSHYSRENSVRLFQLAKPGIPLFLVNLLFHRVEQSIHDKK